MEQDELAALCPPVQTEILVSLMKWVSEGINSPKICKYQPTTTNMNAHVKDDRLLGCCAV
jgi:hypothetical protein